MKKYVLVGLGGRSEMFTNAITGKFHDTSKLIAVCDSNKGRLKGARALLKKDISDVKGYLAEDFDLMLKEQKPDCVIVCTKDSTHDDYICRSLNAGIDVISEKPMTTDEKKCQKIIDTVNKSKKSVRVTFNYRYSPPRSQVKQLLASGAIGRILSVDFQWLLDTHHGADYFRRWHRNKKNSGGLMVHKATHHFDLVNWWISSVPKKVMASGQRIFYTEQQANNYGLRGHGQRCLDCNVSSKCNYYLDLNSMDHLVELYLNNEKYDGYYRDMCIFSDQIDIEDNMNVIVDYENGVKLSYSLNAFLPYEGYRIAFNGTKGRLEHACQETSYINGDNTVQGALKPESTTIKIFPHFQAPYNVDIAKGTGAHAGGDEVMLNDIFGNPPPDPLLRAADYVQGSYSILTGIAANKSMKNNCIVNISDLISFLPEPVFPEMPGIAEQIPYVPDAKHNWEVK